MTMVGYAFVQQALNLMALPPQRPAVVKPTLRIEENLDHVAVPTAMLARMGLEAGDPLAHLLFALKHEGVNLGILMEALSKISGNALLAEIHRAPGGAFARRACYLWEEANGTALDDAPAVTGAAVDLFDPKRYVTMPGERNARWRVNFNGLGSPRYCATVERTPAVQRAIDSKLLDRIHAYADHLDASVRDRALTWAYLDETRSTFAIEKEVPDERKQQAFVALLHAAHARRPLSEDYLVELQQTTVPNPLDRAVSFRGMQNYLSNGLHGAPGVTYLPPPPHIAVELMEELMAFANRAPKAMDPLIAGAVASFGFVFIHPFMDGNGRLSRFLIHHALCRSGQLENGLILPISIAMKKHEYDYLKALQAFSIPARQLWDVTWIGEDNYEFQYAGSPGYEVYRYWDATPAVDFCSRMAEQALDVGLRKNTEFLLRYDRVHREIDRKYDVRGSDLATLISVALENNGVISKKRRDRYRYIVPDEVFDAIEQLSHEVLRERADELTVGKSDK
jgi:hypothetical protein